MGVLFLYLKKKGGFTVCTKTTTCVIFLQTRSTTTNCDNGVITASRLIPRAGRITFMIIRGNAEMVCVALWFIWHHSRPQRERVSHQHLHPQGKTQQYKYHPKDHFFHISVLYLAALVPFVQGKWLFHLLFKLGGDIDQQSATRVAGEIGVKQGGGFCEYFHAHNVTQRGARHIAVVCVIYAFDVVYGKYLFWLASICLPSGRNRTLGANKRVLPTPPFKFNNIQRGGQRTGRGKPCRETEQKDPRALGKGHAGLSVFRPPPFHLSLPFFPCFC